MSTLVCLTMVILLVALGLSITCCVNLVSMARNCPWLRLAARKSNLRSKLMPLIPIWCICYHVSRLMTFPFWPSRVLCTAIFLNFLIIPLTLSTLSIMPNVTLRNCPLKKNRRIIMTFACGFLGCLLQILLLPWLMILNVISLIYV